MVLSKNLKMVLSKNLKMKVRNEVPVPESGSNNFKYVITVAYWQVERAQQGA